MIFFLRFICMFCLHVCLCATCIPGVLGNQNRELDSLELELWIAGSHVSARNQTQVLYKNKCS